MRRWTREEVEQIAEWRAENVPLSEIAVRMGATKGQIAGVVKNYGMNGPSPRARADTRGQVAALVAEGKCLRFAAEQIGITYQYACTLNAEARR